MSESKHTPGPWSVESVWDGRPLIAQVARFGRAINVVSANPEAMPPNDAAANARLIAAAPDLLRVAGLLVDWLDEDEGAHKLCDTARAAIAKAEGRP